MATALDIRLWFDDPVDVVGRFGGLLECVSVWPPVGDRSWQRFAANDTVGGRPLAEHPARGSADGVSVPELHRLAADWNRDDIKLSANGSARLEAGSVPLTVESWGSGWIESGAAFGPRSLVGDASIWLHRCSQLLARDPGADANLDSLLDLLVDLVDVLDPASLKVFTDVSPYLPIDAHVLYVRSADSVVDDLRLMAQAWTRGLPGIDPLGRDRPERAFHEWRGRDGSRELHAALARVIDRADTVTAATVDAVLQSGQITTHPCRHGVLVLDYPHFVDGFADSFYLAVLEAAGQG